MPVMTNEDCAMYYGTTTVVDSTICTSGAGGRSTCGGDSGGPVVYSTGSADILASYLNTNQYYKKRVFVWDGD